MQSLNIKILFIMDIIFTVLFFIAIAGATLKDMTNGKGMK